MAEDIRQLFEQAILLCHREYCEIARKVMGQGADVKTCDCEDYYVKALALAKAHRGWFLAAQRNGLSTYPATRSMSSYMDELVMNLFRLGLPDVPTAVDRQSTKIDDEEASRFFAELVARARQSADRGDAQSEVRPVITMEAAWPEEALAGIPAIAAAGTTGLTAIQQFGCITPFDKLSKAFKAEYGANMPVLNPGQNRGPDKS